MTPTILETRFGAMVVDPERIIEFTHPLLGLEEYRRFTIIEAPESRPFLWLQSVDEADVALPLADPWCFFPDYKVEVPSKFLQEMGPDHEVEVAIYCVVSKGGRGLGMNLAAPVLIHHQARQGAQVVLDSPAYKPYHPLETSSPVRAYAKGA